MKNETMDAAQTFLIEVALHFKRSREPMPFAINDAGNTLLNCLDNDPVTEETEPTINELAD